MAIMPNCRILSYTTNRLHSFTSEYYENCLRPKGCIFICTCFCHALCTRQDRKCTWTPRNIRYSVSNKYVMTNFPIRKLWKYFISMYVHIQPTFGHPKYLTILYMWTPKKHPLFGSNRKWTKLQQHVYCAYQTICNRTETFERVRMSMIRSAHASTDSDGGNLIVLL